MTPKKRQPAKKAAAPKAKSTPTPTSPGFGISDKFPTPKKGS